MDIKLLVGLLSFIGVVLGATLQYFFTKHIENQRHARELRSKAYMDYLKCASEQAQYRPSIGSPEQKEIFARTGDAKARICLYGSNEAIAAFSKFEELGANMETAEKRASFTNMISTMRKDSGNKAVQSSKEMQNILLGVRE